MRGTRVADGAVLVYRLFAIIDAYRDAAGRWPSVREHGRAAFSLVILGVLLGGTLLMHGWLGFVGFKAYDTVVAISHPFSSPTLRLLLPGSSNPPHRSRARLSGRLER